jgi:hypothetical protein
MHISLDSALGQQRRLNSVGESITQIAPDPAAAYSLRSLTGGDPKVVRVRRASDNHEQDFTASDVSSGALQDFVNAQVVAPLDIQALSATGRDGDFLIAKAAYSLRSLGTRQATLAATGDTVARANGKFVCQVRRDSDDALKSFTATEITDGTLVDFVGLIPNGVFANTGYESFTNASESGFTASNTGSTGFAISDIADGGSGNVINVSFDISITNGSPSISLRSSLAGGSLSSNSSTYTSSGSYTATLTATGSYVGVGFTEGDAPSNFTVSNFKVLGNGFVKTWYDQSVTTQAGDTATGNHATQATAAEQPKIVSAGSLITGGGIAFDGSDDQLDFTALNATDLAIFSVLKFDSVSGQERILGEDSTNSEGFGIANATTAFFRANGGSSNSPALNATVSTSGDFLYSANRASNTLGFFTNGVASATATNSDAFKANSIGGSTNPIDGNLKEIVIYETDQTDNRVAIEANIGEVYSIDLPSGVDPGFDQVDGFVETWYDQSGNGNNAVQATASLQPKIVNAGSLLADGILFGANINLPLSGTGLDIFKNVAHGNIFSVIKPLDTGTSGDRYFSAAKNTGTSARFLFGDSQDTSAAFRIGGRALDGDSFSDEEGTTTHSNAVSLLTGFINYGTKTGTLFLNGSQTDTATLSNMTAGNTSDTSSALAAIGDLQSSGALTADFNAKEMIIYNTDQSSNRTAIEANIISHYGIS